jgi:hypothetical protein
MDFQTQTWVCEFMCGMIPESVSTVLEPTPGEGNLVDVLKNHGFRVIAPINFYNIELTEVDAVVMNPPFSPMDTGYKILYKTMEMTKIIIALMPWLTLINSQKRTKIITDFGLKSVTHLPRKAFPGARVQTCILEMRKGHEGTTELNFI